MGLESGLHRSSAAWIEVHAKDLSILHPHPFAEVEKLARAVSLPSLILYSRRLKLLRPIWSASSWYVDLKCATEHSKRCNGCNCASELVSTGPTFFVQ